VKLIEVKIWMIKLISVLVGLLLGARSEEVVMSIYLSRFVEILYQIQLHNDIPRRLHCFLMMLLAFSEASISLNPFLRN